MTAMATLLGLIVGIVATRDAHVGHGRGARFWGRRIGRSRFRRANLPVGGSVLFVLAAVFPVASGPLVGAGAAMAAAAVGYRLVDPLPPSAVRRRRPS